MGAGRGHGDHRGSRGPRSRAVEGRVARPRPRRSEPPIVEPGQFFISCGLGLESALVGELRALGAEDIVEAKAGATCRGDRKFAYAASLWLRSAIRVQELLLSEEVRNPEELYRRASSIDWSRFLHKDLTLAVDAHVRDSAITHNGYAALRVKDAIVDQFREKTGDRPNVDTEVPDLPLKLVLRQDHALLYRDYSGTSLHKRGWRPIQVKSPLNEATAAGILLLSGWDAASPLVDPMCGSGTFVVEAALLAAQRAPGLNRHFPFENWPDFDEKLWESLKADARKRARRTLPFVLEGNDRHPGAIALARQGAQAAGVGDLVKFHQGEARDWEPTVTPKWVFANPPYGERIGEGEDLTESWKSLGNFLHQKCGGAAAFVLAPTAELTRQLGLKASKKWVIMNGTIECRLLRYDVREKSR